ncbi:thiamine diphosphokinase [Thermosipho ferrireducens]|uniref:Thiamine diphosphokinase n=1 Tax=Thermosipho ferrireducens TaxID=2571116 RepID=A0ABX7S6U9_9BACT|nr:thiamine diphosphokinase [Thermosipho ferrireducens]QTA37495.1 thiamine diphosphokinase [Thermosipho ferrireducens]
MKASIVLNGSADETLFLSGDIIIGVDGGADYLKKRGVIPHVVIGDMDSLSGETLEYFKMKGVEIIQYPAEKDETDCELAIEYALKKGARFIELLNFQGERLDMIFALFGLMGRYDIPIVAKSEKLEIGVLKSTGEFETFPGELWSFLPLCKSNVKLEGFKYNYDGEMSIEYPIGISNEAVVQNVKIEIVSGKVVYFRWKKRPL